MFEAIVVIAAGVLLAQGIASVVGLPTRVVIDEQRTAELKNKARATIHNFAQKVVDKTQ